MRLRPQIGYLAEHKDKVAESDKENTELEHIPTQAVII